MKPNMLFCLAFFALSLTSCAYDSEGDLVDAPEEQNDPVELVTYVDNIQPLMENSCTQCHANPPTNGAPFSLDTYTRVRDRANGILAAMSRSNGAPGAMPPSGRLPQSTINLVEQWIADGTPEN